MTTNPLISAWITLVVLSATTALLSLQLSDHGSRTGIAAAVLVLAGAKVRVILSRFLGLGVSRFWMRTFDLCIGGFLAITYVLYLAGGRA